MYATIIADEKGITQDNVDAMVADPPDAEAARLLGVEGELQTAMGLAPDAFYQVIKQVGNYNDIFEHHLVPVGLSRQGSANASAVSTNVCRFELARDRCNHRPNESNRRARRLLDTALGGWCFLLGGAAVSG